MAEISISPTSNFEGTSTNTGDPNTLSWTVSLDAPASSTVTVGYRLLAGTGSVGTTNGLSDVYRTSSFESFITFAAGETSKTIDYNIEADNIDEVDEAVVLEVFNPSGATLAGDAPVLRATGWVLDDDGDGNNLALFVSRPVLVETDSGETQASFEISLSRPAPEDFTITYATVDGSAVAGEDYTATSGTLSFVEGQTSAAVTVPVSGDTKVEPTELFTLDISKPAPVAAVSLGSAEIFDDDAGGASQPTVNVSPTSNFEGTSTNTGDPNTLSWTVSLDAPASSTVTVGYRLLAGTGSVGTTNGLSDVYRTSSFESFITFAAGETSKTIDYNIEADNIDEVDEAVVLEVFNPSGATLAGDAPVLRATGWVLDDDGDGNNLALFVSRPVLVETDSGETQASFEISLSRPAPEDFTITYATVDGSAVAGEDYTATSGTLSFVEGQTSAAVTVPVSGDTKVEPTELFTLDISKPAPVAAVSLGSAEIFDDDAGGASQPTVNVSPTSNFEGTSTNTGDPNTLSWTVSLDAPASSTVTVGYRLLAGTGSVGTTNGLSDVYRTSSFESFITFAAGETSKTIDYNIEADNIDEVDEAVVLEVFNPSGATLAGDAPVLRATGWVLDDDGDGNNLALFVSRPVLVETDSGETQASFEISLSRPAPEDFTITYATVDGSAVAGEDYTATSGTLSFVEGQTSAAVTVPVSGDTKVEPTELFTLDISKPAPVAAVSLGSAEIFDDDAGGASQPTVNVSPTSNFEGTSTNTGDPNTLSWTVSLDAPASSTVTVGYRLLAGTGSVGTTNGLSDVYRTSSFESFITFAAGETSKTIDYNIEADNIDEVDEAVVLEVFNPSGATLAGDAPVLRATGWVLDDDGDGNNLALFVSRPVLVETDSGETQASFEISLSRPAPEDFTITYATVDGSAVAGEDYTATSGTLSFVEGQTSAAVTVPVSGDTKVEPTELFTLDISKPAPVAAVSLGSAEIFDDDAGGASQPTVNVSPTSNFEGTSTNTGDPNTLSWTVSLDAPASSTVTVGYRLLAGTGSVGTTNGLSDVYRTSSFESFITFAAGETSKTIDYNIEADNIDEVDEAVVLEVFNPSGATLAGDAPVLRATGWVLDDDGDGNNLALFVSRPVLVETDSGETQASFEISLSRPAPEDFTITYATVDGSAVAGEDYTATSGTLSFVEGQTSAAVTVPVSGDTKVEPTELFTLDISKPAPVAAVSLGSAEIFDDDAGGASQPTVNVSPTSNFEGTSTNTGDPNTLSWTVSLDAPASSTVTVGYRLLAGTGSVGTTNGLSDVYRTSSFESFITFAAGETSKTIDYNIEADNIDEVDEAVVLEVFNPSGATLAGDAPVLRATGWVLDDDGDGNNLALFVSRPVLVETDSGETQASFEISLSRPAPEDFTITYATVDGSAVAGEDYTATSGTLSFVEGQTSAAVTVPVSGDTKVEPTELFTLDISKPAPVAAVSLGSAEIFDDDAGGASQPTVNVSPTSNFEGTSTNTGDPNTLSWTVSLDAPASSTVTVGYRLLAGTGSVGTTNGLSDVYRTSSFESFITFAAGETSKTIDYNIEADNIDEVDEAVVLEVFNPSGATLAGDAPVLRATGWVLDDDGDGNNLALFVSRPVLVETDSGETQASFEISLSRPAPEDFTITYATVDGSAVAGEDYTATSGTLSFVEGQTSAAVTVPVSGDTKVEPTELFTLDISKPAPVAAVSLGSAEIFDDDAGGASQPTVNVSPTSNFEGTSTNTGDPNTLSWTVSLDAPASSTVTVGYRLLAGTGSVGTTNGLSDVYRTSSFESFITFAAGETSKTIDYNIEADNIDEVDEAVVLEVFNPSGATLAGDAPVLRATGWVLDDDGDGNNLALFVLGPDVKENLPGGSVATFNISLSRPAISDLTFAYTTANGSAEAGLDYEARSGTISFKEGQTRTAVNVPIIGDAIVEFDETFTLDVTPTAALASGEAGTDGVGTIMDNGPVEEVATVSLSVSPVSALEGDSGPQTVVTFTLSRSGDTTNAVTATFLAGGSATAGSDYADAIPASLTIPAGAAQASFTVTVQGDEDVEGDEEITVTIDGLDRADHGIGTASATHTIEEEPGEGDVPPVAADDAFTTDEDTALAGDLFADNGAGADSDADGDPFTLTAASVGGVALSLGAATELAGGGTLTVGTDGSLAFDPDGGFEALGTGDTATVEVAYTIADDDGSDDATATITIAGVNDAPEITSGAAFTIPENQTAVGSVTAMDVDSATVSYAITGGADAGLFDIDTATGALSFLAAPDFESPGDDGANNVYDLTVSASDGEVSTPQNITVTVTDVEPEPDAATVSLSVSPVSALEGDSGPQTVVTFTLSRSGDTTNAVTATFLAGGSATAGSDYADAIPASLTIPAGAAQASFTVTVQGDEDVEGDEEITVTIDGLDRADHGIGTASATHTIEEEPGEGDVPPVAADDAFTTDEDTALAGDLFADNGAGADSDADGDPFTLTAASVGGVALSLGAATELAGGGTLTVGTDGSLAFDPDGGFEALGTGDTATVEVAYTIADDDGSDDATATITIAGVNDAPEITSGAAFTIPENQTAVGSVTAMDVDSATVSYAITGGADAGLFDIDTATGALSFLAAPDFESPGDDGANNVYDLTVSASDGEVSTPQNITVTVTDVEPEPDAATVSLSVSPVSALEGDSGPQTVVTFTLSRSGDTTNAVTATFLAGGSATAGSDYADAIPASLTIPAGAAQASFTVTVQGDEDVEGDEEITVTIDGLDRADHGIGTASATHTIEEEPGEGDVPPVAADDAFTTDEDTALAGDLFADNGAGADSDADGDPFTLTAASVGGVALSLGAATELAGGGTLTVGTDGSLAFDPDGGFEALGTGDTATVEVAYTIADDDGSDDATATITIAGVNDAPEITSGAAFTIPENQTAVGSVTAMDVDSATVSYAITGGADAGLFDIDTATGALSFLAAPDFESPGDDGANNVYDLTVSASDGEVSTPQNITVTVTDVEPEPDAATVSLSVSPVSALEGDSGPQTVVTFTLSRSGDTTNAVTATFLAGGSATAGSDYADAIPASLTIPAGAAQASFTVTVQGDEDVEGDEEITVTIDGLDRADHGIGTASATHTIEEEPGEGDVPPVAADDAFTTDEDTALAGDLFADNGAGADSDADGDPFTLTAASVGGVALSLGAATELAGGGTLTVGTDGSLAFDPDGGFEALGTGDTATVEVAYTIADDDGSDDATATITIAGVNDAPEITSGAAFTIPENQTAVGSVTAMDVDSATVSYAITGGADAGLFDIDTATGALSFLAAPDFESPGDDGANNVYDLTVSASDGEVSTPQNITVTVTDVEPEPDAATVSLSVSPVSALEGDSGPQTVVTFTLSRSGDTTNAVTATFLAGGSATAGSDYADAIPASLTIPAGAAQASFTVTVQGDEDVEGDEEITVTIDGLDRADHGIGTASATHTIEEEPGEGDVPPVAADDAFTTDEDTALAGDLFADNGAGADSDADGDPFTLTAASVGGVALSLGAATELAGGGTLTVGTDGSLAFDPDGGFEALGTGDTATVEVAYTIADDDGSDDATATITIAGVNDAPEITSGAAFTIPENQTAVGSVTAMDVDSATVSYAITGGADAGLFDIDTATGALSFLAAPDFESPGDDGANNVYDLTVSASDGEVSTPQNITVTVTDVEPEPDAATVSLSVSPVSALEGDSGPQTVVTFTLSRSGDTTNAVTATFLAGGSATAGSDYADAIPASLTIPAGAAQASFTVTVQGDEDVEGDEEITVTIDGLDRADHGIGTASATHTIEEEPGEGDVPPVAADDAFTTDEDTALAGDLFADNGAGADSDADGDPFTLTAASVGGVALSLGAATELAGGGTLTVGTDGSLAFDPDGGFEALGTGDTATVEVAYTIADDDGSDDATATITIAGVNDAPEITSGAAFTIPENQTAVGSVTAMDVDSATVSYAITGGADAGLFDIDTATGALSFLAAPDFESPGDDGANNVYDLTVSASDGEVSTPQNITVTVTDVEPEPDAATVSLSVSPVSALEGDSGPQTVVTFTLSRSGDTTNAVTATFLAGGSATAGSDYADAIPASLTIPAGAAQASFTVTVQGDEDVEGDEEITVTIDGLDRADHGIGTASATHTIEEEPGEGDVPPVAADDAFTTDEDTALAGDLFADNGAGADSDADGDPFTLTAASVGGVALSLGAATELAGGGTLTVGTDGSLAFDPDGGFEALGTGDTATVEVAYTIADDDGSDDATATITIAGVNDAPEITSGAAFTIPENQTAVGSVTAMDVDSATVSYAITGGADAGLFDIDTATGALSFLAAPDFESPGDDGANNVYDLTVSASDGEVSTPQNITVTVTDVEPEGPERDLIVGTAGIDYLVGTAADERIEGRGGPLDQVLGGGGADEFVYKDLEGSRDVLAIRDFSAAEGDMLDLQGAEIALEVVVGNSTYLILEGADRDLIILDGVTEFDTFLLA